MSTDRRWAPSPSLHSQFDGHWGQEGVVTVVVPVDPESGTLTEPPDFLVRGLVHNTAGLDAATPAIKKALAELPAAAARDPQQQERAVTTWIRRNHGHDLDEDLEFESLSAATPTPSEPRPARSSAPGSAPHASPATCSPAWRAVPNIVDVAVDLTGLAETVTPLPAA